MSSSDETGLDRATLEAKREIGESFWHDARDFAVRFDALWDSPHVTRRSARLKCLVDLFMGCECILKAHIFLADDDRLPTDLYRKVRTAAHDVTKLVALTTASDHRSDYDVLIKGIGGLPVVLRYSLDAERQYDGWQPDRPSEVVKLQRLLRSKQAVKEVRDALERLIFATRAQVTGYVDIDFHSLVESSRKVDEAMARQKQRNVTERSKKPA
ncbi:hypothetical protein MK974_24245 [Burkholderia ambifaria]|uniref:hypothetical protein n=1 Tax=Burkholderia ambifaria TaxID=152480 RepID=UPI0022A98C5C|nr:hypothetical protein [Burkholderia ambifaria]WAS56215.1 hypothetical protein MK974_24245 [Burkholderia ambifaria]